MIGVSLIGVALLVASCAATGPHSTTARPVIYSASAPTPALQAQQQAATDDCVNRALAQGLTPDEKNNETGRRAAQGAATAGVAAAVGALITGHGADSVVRAGATAAAVGGSAGAVSGAMNDRPNGTYRNYVHRCLADKGFQVIGWN
jgi:outer membrane lipoprotein SlyB